MLDLFPWAHTGLLNLQDFGYLALAIVHAGAYIGHSPHMSISKYRELFLAQRQRMLEEYSNLRVKIDGYKKTVYTTWRMCYDLLEHNGDSQRILWLIAYLHHDGITENIFQRAAINLKTLTQSQLPPSDVEMAARNYVKEYLSRFLDSSGHWDAMLFSGAISELASYSLIDFDRANLAYNIHVLVQDWARTVSPQSPDLALECTTTLLSQSIDLNASADAKSLGFRRGLVLHTNKILSEHRREISANHAAHLADVYEARGQWIQEEALEVQVYQARKRVFGERHIYTLQSMDKLARTYMNRGRWDDAERLELQVMGAWKELFGEADPITLASIGNLSCIYTKQG
jgi:hypothetical protein